MAAQPAALKPAEAQHAVHKSAISLLLLLDLEKYVPRTLDMMAMQGFSGWRLGLCTRSVFSGGRRMAFALPDMFFLGAGIVFFFVLFLVRKGRGAFQLRSRDVAAGLRGMIFWRDIERSQLELGVTGVCT